MKETKSSETGTLTEPTSYRLVCGLFLRLLALVYLIAFVSISGQIDGLAGPDGILPYGRYLESYRTVEGDFAFLIAPGLFWLSAETWALEGAAYLGAGISILLFFDIWPRVSALALFVLYLSLVGAGSVFMHFQWDAMLLEMGFLAIFLPGGSRIVVFLYRWLLFRLRFLSGAFKVLSGDPSWLGLPALLGGEGAWRGLTALNTYFETQPLPHVGAWYAHQLPEWLLMAGTATVLILELVVPFMMFMPRRYRLFAAWATIGFQLAVMLTSNHTFFNVLTLVLCLFLFDDRALARVVPTWARGWLTRRFPDRPEGAAKRAVAGLLAAAIVPLSVLTPLQVLDKELFSDRLNWVLNLVKRYHVVHPYHVFPTMNRERIEVVIEGSMDAVDWREYGFKFKADRVDEPLRVSQPHHPRLDWMLWFVPSDNPDHDFWMPNLAGALFKGSKPVLDLFDVVPFGGAPPNFIRISFFRYRFAAPEERAKTGAWWARTYLGPATPVPWLSRF